MGLRTIFVGLVLAGLAVGQNAVPPSPPSSRFNTLAFDSGPGSFRTEGTGKLVIDTLDGVGTVYVSQYKGVPPAVTGMRLEYSDPNRLCYHGMGRVVLDGKFRAVNYLGSRVKGSFTGKGFFRLYGDLDNDLRTGLVWYPGFTKNGKQVLEYWETYGREFHIPMPAKYDPRPLDADKVEKPARLNE